MLFRSPGARYLQIEDVFIECFSDGVHFGRSPVFFFFLKFFTAFPWLVNCHSIGFVYMAFYVNALHLFRVFRAKELIIIYSIIGHFVLDVLSLMYVVNSVTSCWSAY